MYLESVHSTKFTNTMIMGNFPRLFVCLFTKPKYA